MGFTFTNSKGQVYGLHRRDTPLADGRTRSLYFFSRQVEDTVDEVPKGYSVVEAKTGLPLLRKG